MQTNSQKLYQIAFSTIGKDASPFNYALNEFGCAESVSSLISQIIQFPIITGTSSLLNELKNNPQFEEIAIPEQGCIIISATGTGNGKLENGHTGIIGKNLAPDNSLWIMSNDSRSGLWSVNYTIKRWKDYYEDYGGFPTRYFRLLG
jgi:hypothetical protein